MDPLISEFGFEIADLLKPWIAILVSGIVALWLKDWITSFVQGVKFRMNFQKTQSDEIAIENCYAQMRKKLRELNLGAPSESSMRLVSNFAKVEELILLDELWEELDANNQS